VNAVLLEQEPRDVLPDLVRRVGYRRQGGHLREGHWNFEPGQV